MRPLMMNKICLVGVSLCMVFANLFAAQGGEWIEIFDGESLEGWTANENPASFRVEGGCIVADGPRSHLFYTGPALGEGMFRNFEFVGEVYSHPRGSSAVYFHAENLGPGWTVRGLPVKITNSRVDKTATGGIYDLPETYRPESTVADGEWFELGIKVLGNTVTVSINGEVVTEYIQNPESLRFFQKKHRKIGQGTFALQCHGEGQRVDFRNLRVRALPAD